MDAQNAIFVKSGLLFGGHRLPIHLVPDILAPPKLIAVLL